MLIGYFKEVETKLPQNLICLSNYYYDQMYLPSLAICMNKGVNIYLPNLHQFEILLVSVDHDFFGHIHQLHPHWNSFLLAHT